MPPFTTSRASLSVGDVKVSRVKTKMFFGLNLGLSVS